MFALRKSLLHHLEQLFEDGLINFHLVHNILNHTYTKVAFHDSITTELVTMIVIRFHILIVDIRKQIENCSQPI